MLPHDTAAVHIGIGGFEERSATCPAAADVGVTHIREPSLHVIEQVGLLLIGWLCRLLLSTSGVGGAHQRAPEEGQHEQNASVIGGGQQQSHPFRTKVLLEHDVHTAAREHAFPAIPLCHASHCIGMQACGIDHGA